MQKKHKHSLFIFRQDLRLTDNTALRHAIAESEKVMTIFIFDKNILKHFPKNDQRMWFLVEAIATLEKNIAELGGRLDVMHGTTEEIIPNLIKEYEIDAIYFNKSYGSGASTRDVFIQGRCKKHQVVVNTHHDFLLVPIDAVPTRKVFTPFYKLRQKELEKIEITCHHAPHKIEPITKKKHSDSFDYSSLASTKQTPWRISLGRDRIKHFDFANYNETRNFPAVDGSSKLSPYIRFWIVSIREIYKKALQQWAQVYISELARREFWHHIMFHFPETRLIEFLEKRRKLAWDNNEKYFEARKDGKTWYPLIDAWMRQLKAENRMHNRVRMVVASFLTKDLIIDRRRWEEHFKNFLLDYDENVNIGNWQWAASVWADPKPLRIFSPLLQSERFDKECEYIKRRIPELKDVDPKLIHNPIDNDLSLFGYVQPIINHYERSKRAKQIYAKE